MYLEIDNEKYKINVKKKARNKNTYIRVNDNLEIVVTTNIFTTSKQIERIINENITSVTKMINPFYGANRVSIIYEGTKAEFASIETSATIDGETVSWNTGSMISSVTCSDGVLAA